MQTAEPIKIIFMCEFCFQGYVHASDLISHKKEKHEFGVNELKAPATPPLFESKVSTSTENRNLKEMKKSAIKIPTKKPRYKRKSKLELDGSSLTSNEKSTVNTSKKKLHQVLRFKPSTVSCQLCPQTYTNQNLLDRHELVAHGSSSVIKTEVVETENENENDVTGYGSSFAQTDAVQRNSPNEISATRSPKNTNNFSATSAIIIKPAAKNTKLFPCKYCPKMCASNRFLDLHERVHTGERPFKCQHCSKFFAYSMHHIPHEKSCNFNYNSKIPPPLVLATVEINNKEDQSNDRPIKIAKETVSILENVDRASEMLPVKVKEEKPDPLETVMIDQSTSMALSTSKVEYLKCKTEKDPPEDFKFLVQTYKCTFCPEAFTIIEERRIHEKSHSEKQLSECQFCQTVFVSPMGLENHIRRRHSNIQLLSLPPNLLH